MLSPGSQLVPITVYRQYDVAGNVVTLVDARSNVTSIVYSDAYANAFPTKVTNALSQSVQTGYDFSTGNPTSFTDGNGNVSTYSYGGDLLDRLREVDLADGGVTEFLHCDAGGQTCDSAAATTNSITKRVKQNSCGRTSKVVTDLWYDGLGRTVKTHAYDDTGANVVQTVYDGMGRTSQVSNPSRSETPTDFTTTIYDALGRTHQVTAPDGSTTFMSWAGSVVTSVDPAGVTDAKTYDAFGRLVQVVENNGGPKAFTTNYRYDELDDLLGVCQGASFDSAGNCLTGGLGRSFTYDSLKRLLSSTNPESGIVLYSYDPNGNVLTKRDGRGWITCYGTYSAASGACSNGYDALNRATIKTYGGHTVAYVQGGLPPDGVQAPSVSYVWDTIFKGRLSSVAASGVSTTQFSAYDAMGRVTQSSQTTSVTSGQTTSTPSYSFSYEYNSAGGMETETLPSQRKVTTCYDAAGRAMSLAGTSAAGAQTNYASGITYTPHGAIQQITRGDTLTENWTYNNRLQATGMSVGSAGSPRSAFGLDVYYCPNNNAACKTNNGNVLSMTLPVIGAGQTFTYDEINRLSTATEKSSGTGWSQMYGYDPYGNRWVVSNSTRPSLILSPFTPTVATNFDGFNRLQIQGTQYDTSGNQKQIGGYSFQWDSEGRQVSSSINGAKTSYQYDGAGRRVAKVAAGGTTVYVYDAAGELAAEYESAGPVASPCATCYPSLKALNMEDVINIDSDIGETATICRNASKVSGAVYCR